ncbi:MAG: hypothetical protein RLZZ366_1582, partial [Pseudomonadota bacterium]
NDKHFTGGCVEDRRGIDATIRTGDHHDLGALALRQFGPARALTVPVACSETVVSLQQCCEVGHDFGSKAVG